MIDGRKIPSPEEDWTYKTDSYREYFVFKLAWKNHQLLKGLIIRIPLFLKVFFGDHDDILG